MSEIIRKQFDVFQKNKKVVIITTDYNEERENVEIENFISIERAKEVLQMLTTAINEVDNEIFWQDLDKKLPSKKGGVIDTNTGEYIPFSEKK